MSSLFERALSHALSVLPPAFAEWQAPAQDMLRDALARTLRELDLVTREEFEKERTVLHETQKRLEALEARLASISSTDS